MAQPIRNKHVQEVKSDYAVPGSTATVHRTRIVNLRENYPYQAYEILHVAFVVAPIIAGADKFFHLLVNWNQYLAPIVPQLTGLSTNTFMQIVGVIEIVAGIGVAFKPRIFSYVVGLWLCGIVVNLIVQGIYFDIALRDFGLALGAFALARLSHVFDLTESG